MSNSILSNTDKKVLRSLAAASVEDLLADWHRTRKYFISECEDYDWFGAMAPYAATGIAFCVFWFFLRSGIFGLAVDGVPVAISSVVAGFLLFLGAQYLYSTTTNRNRRYDHYLKSEIVKRSDMRLITPLIELTSATKFEAPAKYRLIAVLRKLAPESLLNLPESSRKRLVQIFKQRSGDEYDRHLALALFPWIHGFPMSEIEAPVRALSEGKYMGEDPDVRAAAAEALVRIEAQIRASSIVATHLRPSEEPKSGGEVLVRAASDGRASSEELLHPK